MARRRKTLEEYFWTRVQKGDGCWLWTGSKDTFGYGRIQLSRDGKRFTASRASWIIHNGDIASSKLQVCHKCDVPACVNPDHLFLGTAKDNLSDASRKGRMSVPGKAWRRNMTHCNNGHLFDEDNTYRWGTYRYCRICRAALERQRRQQTREQWKLTAEK
jgi:hypothetical protein